MNVQVALLIMFVAVVGSAPVAQKLDIMDKGTIEEAHSLITKIIKDIPTVHTTWINSKSLTLGDNSTRLQFLKTNMIPSAPVLQSISSNFSLETCLAHIVKGLQLHLNLLKEISKSTMLNKTEGVEEFIAEIDDLRFLIKKLQIQTGVDQSKQASDEQTKTHEHDLAKHLTSTYKTQVAAHLTLQQLQDFSTDVLHSILSIRSMSI